MKIDKYGYEVEEKNGEFRNVLGQKVPSNEVKEVDLTGRHAKCTYCGRIAPSTNSLAFFCHHPKNDYDEYYCGCRGWD